MGFVVLDAAGVNRLAERTRVAAAIVGALRRDGTWPPIVPSEVLVECLTGDPLRDAGTNRLLRTCDVREALPARRARRAASLRARARRGSPVEAIVVAAAEPGGTVITGGPGALEALAEHADGVTVEAI